MIDKLIRLTLFLFFTLLFCQSLHNKVKNNLIVYPESVYSQINKRDVMAAFNILANDLMAELKYDYRSQTLTYNTINELIGLINDGKADVTAISSIDYMNLEGKLKIIPYFFATHEKVMGQEFVLMVPNDQKINSISDLKNKRLIYLDEPHLTSMTEIWLDVLAYDHGIKDAVKFFSELKKGTKPNQVVLSVVFGQSDACILSKTKFDLVSEFNPQLKKKLKIIYISKPLIFFFLCLREEVPDKFKEDFKKFILNLKNHTRGKQIISLVRINSFELFKEEYFIHTRELYEKYKKIKKRK